MSKKVNPYEKKKAVKRRRIGRKQWIVIISLLSVVALIVGIVVAGNLSRASITDPHAGHNHASGEGHDTDADDPHAGHDHGTTSTNTDAKVKYQLYTNADKTYRLVIRDNKGVALFEADKLPKAPIKDTVDAEKGVYELGWATDNGANDFECVYYNEKTGQVSKQFHAPRGTDGVRIAYGSEDQTKIIVQDLFNKDSYYKEHVLEGAYTDAKDIIISGKLQADKKTVLVSYRIGPDAKTDSRHATIHLYE